MIFSLIPIYLPFTVRGGQGGVGFGAEIMVDLEKNQGL
jgi:D-serine dehydratase